MDPDVETVVSFPGNCNVYQSNDSSAHHAERSITVFFADIEICISIY